MTVARHDPSKIRRLEVVGSFWSARVDLRRYLADAIPVRIKGFQKAAVLRSGGGLQPEERIADLQTGLLNLHHAAVHHKRP